MKKKIYILTLARKFPANHPRKGQRTYFEDKYTTKVKKHTIRANYAYWKKIIDEVNTGNAELLVCQRQNGKTEIIQKLQKISGYQMIDIQFYGSDFPAIYVNNDYLLCNEVDSLIKNDGLREQDFKAWFSKPVVQGIIIHFTDLKY